MWDAADPEGHFSYIEFRVDDLAFNVSEPAIPQQSEATPMERSSRLAGAS